MKKLNKSHLMATVAIATLGMSTSQALAFDEVNWEWNKTINSTLTKDVAINIESNPTGLVEIEKIQAQIGDVNATSNVSGVHNNPFSIAGEDGVITIDETVTVTTNYDKPVGIGNAVGATSGIASNGTGDLTVTFIDGTLSEQTNAFTDIIDLSMTGEFSVEAGEGLAQDAIDLPEVVSSATAVGNNQSITSSSAVELHDAQFLIGGFAADEQGSDTEALENVLASTPYGGNTHLDVAAALTLSAALGLVESAEVNATSTVDDILNASVDSAATAVGNNMSVEVAASTPDDAMLIADLTQFSYADITALSSVTNVEVNDYTNFSGADMGPLAETQKALVNSAATAVGNNMSITVSAPVPAL
jgi:hypothetical protein